MRHLRTCLVLTSEAARHPFRASLPPHVTSESRLLPVPREAGLRFFLSSWLAFFCAVMAFIA